MSNNAVSVRRPTRLWRWFAGGFVVVFVAMLVLVKTTAMHPSGQFAVRSPLWRYYQVAVPRAFGPTTLGAANGASSGLMKTMGMHLLVSAAGGCVGLGIGWVIGKRGITTAFDQSADRDLRP